MQGQDRVDEAVAAALEVSGDPDVGSLSGSKRIATATLIRAIGEIVAKTASVALFIAIARELGEAGFGDFIFGLSLSSVLFTAAGFGTEELIARDVARDREQIHHLYGNVIAVKSLTLVALLAVMAVIVSVGGYSATTHTAVMLIALGVAFEVLGKTFHAIFQAHERMQYIAGSLIIQRTAVAAVGDRRAARRRRPGGGLDRLLPRRSARPAELAGVDVPVRRSAAGRRRPLPLGGADARRAAARARGDALLRAAEARRDPAQLPQGRRQPRGRPVRRRLPPDRGDDVRVLGVRRGDHAVAVAPRRRCVDRPWRAATSSG